MPVLKLNGESLVWALSALAQLNRTPFDPKLVLQQFAPPYSAETLHEAATSLGLKVGFKQVQAAELSQLSLPCLAVLEPLALPQNTLFAGRTGNDIIVTGVGNDIVAFNRGDRQDTLNTAGGGSKTLSLGGALDYNTPALRKSANDLVLDTGNSEQVTLKDWYAAGSTQSVINLQVIADAMAAYSPGSSNQLTNQRVQQFDFAALVNKFDQARAADATLTQWNLMNGLLDAHLAGSDSEAMAVISPTSTATPPRWQASA